MKLQRQNAVVSARLILASASPARLATLRAAGLDPEVIVSDVDEDATLEPTPAATAQHLAELKAAAVAARLTDPAGAVVLGCDSLLELDGRALGKPSSPDVARARWQAMRGRAGVLHTGHCLIEPATGRRVGEVASTVVHFADVSDAEIDAYVATGEPLVVAGAFTLDGRGGAFVEAIEGDHHNVVGVSLPLLRRLLLELDIPWPSLWVSG
jgi:septum formation protein